MRLKSNKEARWQTLEQKDDQKANRGSVEPAQWEVITFEDAVVWSTKRS